MPLEVEPMSVTCANGANEGEALIVAATVDGKVYSAGFAVFCDFAGKHCLPCLLLMSKQRPSLLLFFFFFFPPFSISSYIFTP